MGAWGVKARECDYGLDLLDSDVIGYLKESDFHFNVREIKELLRKNILDDIRYENRGSPDGLMKDYIDCAFPFRFDTAVLLIAECIADYISTGALVLYIHEKHSASYDRKVTEFHYTSDDLRELADGLKAVLDPKRSTFHSWRNSEILEEWQEHIKSLINLLEKHIEELSKLNK